MSKRFEEQTKLSAAFLNGIALAIASLGGVTPIISYFYGITPIASEVGPAVFVAGIAIWISVAIVRHLMARATLNSLD